MLEDLDEMMVQPFNLREIDSMTVTVIKLQLLSGALKVKERFKNQAMYVSCRLPSVREGKLIYSSFRIADTSRS